MLIRRCLCTLLLPLFASAPAWADPLYTIDFLPTGFAPAALNDTGQVVGTYGGAAAILSGGTITSLGGILPDSYGSAINNHGDVAGSQRSPYSGNAFAWIGGTVVPIGASLPADMYPDSNTRGINDAGMVAGNAEPFVGEAQRGFLYDSGGIHLIGTFGGDWSYAAAINASGAVTGTATLVTTQTPIDPDRHAYIYQGGTMQDLGTLGGLRSEAYDINDAGMAVGWSETNVDPDNTALSRPFVYRDGHLVDLGSLGGTWGYARALNNAGVIVGASDLITDVGWGYHAFIYLDGHMVDLNALVTDTNGWEIIDATDINDAGQVLGRACRLGTCADVLLDLVPAVPEPASWALLSAGLGLLAWRTRRRGARRLLAAVFGGASALAAPAVLADPLYSATILPANFTAYGIGSDGSVVGSGANADGQGRAFVWQDGTTTFLPTLGGPTAYAIATAGGAVVGSSQSGDFTRGFVYRDGTIQGIGTLYGGDSVAYGINASGQVVGESTDASGNSRAFLYSGGTLTDIGTLGGTDARARGINDAGMIVGGSQPGPGFPNDGAHAFLYHDGTMQDLGTLGGGFSWAEAVNDAGQVAGYSLVAGEDAWHPFLYSGGVMRDLGSFGGLYSEAHAINAAGVVVGYSSFAGFGFSHAFMDAGGGMTDLNTVTEGLGIQVLTDAVGINDAGQIVANSCNEFGFCAPVLLTPVPEPSAALLLLVGGPVLLWRCRRMHARTHDRA